MTVLNRYSKCLKAWARSDGAFAFLDKYPQTRGTTWSAGGCAPLAFALHRLLPRSELWAVTDATGIAQHIIVKWRGLFWDNRGGRQRRSVEKYWAKEPGLALPIRTVPMTAHHYATMEEWETCPAALIADLVQNLKQHCFTEQS